ncbi:MAG: Rrf2 family transcriptional regulator [Bryobacterales bacterium]|nr:Rrf2 family transcriptional regulator [Bryobacterales bacterium]
MMSTTSQYALRALARLSREPSGAAVLGRDLARESDIPANYLSKLLWQLRNAGLVQATRGARGGYRLARPADQVRLIDVVEVFDPVHARPACLMGRGECNERDACAAHHAWKGVRDVYLEFLEKTPLAKIAGGETPPREAALNAGPQEVA